MESSLDIDLNDPWLEFSKKKKKLEKSKETGNIRSAIKKGLRLLPILTLFIDAVEKDLPPYKILWMGNI